MFLLSQSLLKYYIRYQSIVYAIKSKPGPTKLLYYTESSESAT